MKFEEAVKALSSANWEWDRRGFERVCAGLGVRPEADTDDESPMFSTPWGETLQAFLDRKKVTGAELLIEVSHPDGEWDPAAYGDMINAYYKKFEAYASRAAAVLGEPSFSDGPTVRGFPEDQEAMALALWPLKTARFMVQARCGDNQMPFLISIMIAPPKKR